MVNPWEVPSYDCPFCLATDSRECGLVVNDRTGMPKNQDGARKVGCRVMYYHDLRHASKADDVPRGPR